MGFCSMVDRFSNPLSRRRKIMNSRFGCALAALAIISLAVYAGCDSPPPRVGQVSYSSSAGADAMAQFDTNKDGKVSDAELLKAPGLNACLTVMGTDKTKGVTAEMVTNRVKAWQDSKVGLTSLSCTVTRNGQPVADAEVKLVPEKFLGTNVQPASGKTMANGVATLSIPRQPGPDAPPPGVSPGIYRVEITKGGEIPAQYNSATVLGQEVSNDNRDLQTGLKYELKY
jgi:hypothetical protein